MSAEAHAIAQTSANIEKLGTDSNGLLKDAGNITASAFLPFFFQENKAITFDDNKGCLKHGSLRKITDGGSPAYDPANPLFPLYDIYCNIMKRPDGPDTIRGAIDRATGFMCALGNVTYDGVKRTKTLKISTNCFSKTFVDVVASEFGVSSIEAQVQAFPSAAGKAAGFDKFIELRATLKNKVSPGNDKVITYDIAVKMNDNERALALLDLEGSDESSAFALYMNRSTGVMKVEGHNYRDGVFERSVRYNVKGNLSTRFELSKIDLLQAITDESGSSYISISGPKTGRMLRTDGYPNGDNKCYPNGGCAGNTGIQLVSAIFTDPATWFASNAFLGSHANIDNSGSWK